MPIIVNSPFSGKPVKVRDEDVGRAIRDEENRIFYVIQRSTGEGYYGAPTRKGSEKDEKRYDELMEKVELGEVFAKTQSNAVQVHDARGKKRKLSPVRVVAFLLLLIVLAFIGWYYLAGGQAVVNEYLNKQTPVEVEEIIIEEPVSPPADIEVNVVPEEPAQNQQAEPSESKATSSVDATQYITLASPSKEAIQNARSNLDEPDSKDETNQEIEERKEAADNDAAFVVLPSGVKYWIDVKGDEEADEARAGDWVEIEYKAWQPGGVPISSSEEYGPLRFVLWSGQALRGWDEAITGMKPGERRTLILPPELVHNDSLMTRDPDKPVENTLMCEVHLLQVKPGIDVKTIKSGTGRVVRPGDNVTLDYEARLSDKKNPFMSRQTAPGQKPLEFQVGKGQVIAGLELAVTGMTVGEIREVTIPPYLAYGSAGFAPLIPADATLVYIIQLEKLEHSKEKKKRQR